MNMLSFLTDGHSCIGQLTEDECYLHPKDLVILALNMIQKGNLTSLAICENSKYVGRIYADELKHFINWEDQKDQLVYHKLNFDLLTAITVMKREFGA